VAKYVAIPSNKMTELFESIRSGIVSRGGRVEARVAGKEVVWDIQPPQRQALVRIYTSLGVGSSTARAVGKDAIRIAVGALLSEGRFKPVQKAKRVFRTAPEKATEEERVAFFMDRFRAEIRSAYASAKEIVACPKCAAPMLRRTAKKDGHEFLGCSKFPECSGTRAIRAGC
jgi:hypothetical protein